MINESKQHESTTDVEAFTQLWLSNHHTVAAFIRVSIRNLHDAEDLLQDVAREASRNFDRFDRSRPFSAWLIGIARYRLIDYFNHQQRKNIVVMNSDTLEALAEAHIRSTEQADSRLGALRDCMRHLPERQRHLLRDRYYTGLSTVEIANRTGKTSSSINQVFYRIRKALARCVEDRLGVAQ